MILSNKKYVDPIYVINKIVDDFGKQFAFPTIIYTYIFLFLMTLQKEDKE